MYIKGQLLASAPDQQLKNGGPEGGGPLQDFKRQLASGLQTVMTYEDAEQQAAARDVLDYPKIKENTGGGRKLAEYYGMTSWILLKSIKVNITVET